MDVKLNIDQNRASFGAKLKIKNRSCWNAIRDFHEDTKYVHRVRMLHCVLDDFKKFNKGKIYEVSHKKYTPKDPFNCAADDIFIFTCDGKTVLATKGMNFIEALADLMGKDSGSYLNRTGKKLSSFDVFVPNSKK